MFEAYLRAIGLWWLHLTNRQPNLPPSVDELLAEPSSVRRRHPRRYHPSLRNNNFPDTALASLYRLYEFYIIDDTISFRNEIEWFWHRHDWQVHAIPDPSDTDPLRYALLGGLTEILCQSFNRLINLGLPRDSPPIVEDFAALAARPKVLECPPEWLANIQPLPEPVFVPNGKGERVAAEDSSLVFRKWNIFIEHPHSYFV